MSDNAILDFIPYHNILKLSDFKKDRPFISYYAPELLSIISETINSNPPDLEVATLAFEELEKFRSKNKSAVKKARQIVRKSNNNLIKWLSDARELIKDIPRSNKGNSTLYVILRSGYTIKHHYYGAYVGSTSKTPEQRFNQHKNGYRSARGIEKNGIQLLRSLYWKWVGISGKKENLLKAESVLNFYLNCSLKTLKVTGDIQYPIEKWDKKYDQIRKNILKDRL